MSLNYEITQAKINVMNALLENSGRNDFEVWVDSVETPDTIRDWVAMLFMSAELAPLTNVIEFDRITAMNWRNLDGSASYHVFFNITSHTKKQLGGVIKYIKKELPRLIIQLRAELEEIEAEVGAYVPEPEDEATE